MYKILVSGLMKQFAIGIVGKYGFSHPNELQTIDFHRDATGRTPAAFLRPYPF